MSERKESPVGIIPVEWDVVKLRNIADIDAESLKSTTNPDFNFFYIDISSVKTGKIDKPTSKMSFKNSPSRARRILLHDDVLMSTVRPNLKSFAYFDSSSGDYICSTGFSVLRSKNNNGKFIFHNLFSESITNQIDALVVGSNYPAINSSDVKDLLIPYPPLPEQKKIAEILTSVDEVIETTETQINKLKDLKKGMMNELLTKGIGHTEFKDSPVGRIPVGWEVKEFCEVSNVIDSLHQTPVFSSTGFPMVRVSDIKQGKINLENTEKVDGEIFLQFTKKYLPVTGDLLISRVGSYGVCSIVDTEQKFCLGQNAAIIHPTIILSKFLYYWIYSPSIHEQIENEVAGSSYKSLSLATIRKLKTAIPSKPEQEQIANIIWSIDTSIEQKQSKLTQTKNLKKSLMADLLTGRVRVKV
jgi:type I restriction enzyme, S subunit